MQNRAHKLATNVGSNRLHRRDLLKQTAVAVTAMAAGAALPAKLLAAEKEARKLSFGLVTYQLASQWDLPTLIANCEKAKVHGVELRTTHKHGVEPSLNAAERKEVRQRFADSQVTLIGLGSNESFDSVDPDVVRKSIETTKQFVRLSHDIGASGVKVKPNDFHDGVPKEQTIQQIGNALQELGEFAADYDQQIRLEVHGKCSELPTIKAIMDIANNSRVAVCWNSNATDLQGNGLEYNFNLVRDRFGDTLHVRRLNSSNYPFAEMIAMLVKSKYEGWVLLEDSKPSNDKVAELEKQRELFEKMVADATT